MSPANITITRKNEQYMQQMKPPDGVGQRHLGRDEAVFVLVARHEYWN